MSIEFLVILTLVGLLIFQQVYFMRQVQKLLDKLMSRDYTQYKLAETPVIKNAGKKKENLIPEDYGALSDFSPI